MRASPAASKVDYGPSLQQLLKNRGFGAGGDVDNIEMDDPEGLAARTEPMSAGYNLMQIRKKRQSAIMKQILKNGGYGDLARMVNIRKGEE